MPRTNTGGTKMWCSKCQSLKPCKKVEPSNISPKYKDGCAGQHWHMAGHKDIYFFRRGRVCQACGSLEMTAETPERCLDELAGLRKEVVELRIKASEVEALREQLDHNRKDKEAIIAQIEKAQDLLSALAPPSDCMIEVFEKAS